MTPQQLKNEFTTDPTGLGYATATTQGKVDLINQPRPTIAINQRVSNEAILRCLGQVPFRTLGKPTETAWKTEMDLIRSISDFDVFDPTFDGLMQAGVSQGVLLQDEADYIKSLGTRPGSRAEQLWGAGVLVTLNDGALAQ